MVREKPVKFVAGAAIALLAGAAFSNVSESFETGTWASGGSASDLSGTWTGDGFIDDGTVNSIACGKAITGTDTKVLKVQGTVTCANTGDGANQAQADFLVNVDEPNDELESTLADVQIAVAVGTEASEGSVPLMIYCKEKSSGALAANAGWMTGPSVTLGSWHRVSLVFDYVSSLCKVSVDGVPFVSNKGFLSADTADQPSVDGAWYGIASTPSANKVTSLQFVGAASVDDVVIGEAAKVAENFSGTKAVALSGSVNATLDYAKLNALGVTADNIAVAKVGESGLTVAEQLEAGIEPGSDTKFAVSSLSATSGTAVTLSFPGTTATTYGLTRTYTVTGNTSPDGNGTSVDVTAGTASTTEGVVALPVTIGATNAKVVYLSVTATAATAN